MKKIILLIILTLYIFLFSSCQYFLKERFHTDKDSTFEYIKGYTYEYLDLNDLPNAIYDLTEKGRKNPIIVFPVKIDGRKVTDIGVIIEKGFLGTFKYSINFGKHQKIYFNSYNIFKTELNFNYDNYLKLFVPNFSNFNLKTTKNKFLNNKENEKNIIYLNYIEYENYLKTKENKYNIQPANVSYYIGDANPFFIDDVDGDYIISEPPTPYKEGYEFDGWYYDVNFEKEIDFNYEKIPNKIYDNNGNYLYVENKFYAKWVNKKTKEVFKYKN